MKDSQFFLIVMLLYINLNMTSESRATVVWFAFACVYFVMYVVAFFKERREEKNDQ